jgi:hypothetical protein
MLFGQKLQAPLEGTLERLLLLDRFNELSEQVRKNGGEGCFLERFLETMNVRPRVSASDLLLAPKEGPVVAVANHPFGLIEGAILGSLLAAVRPDVKVMANHLLATVAPTNAPGGDGGPMARRVAPGGAAPMPRHGSSLWQAGRNCLLAGRQRVATILPTGISFLAFQRLTLYLFRSNQAQFFRREGYRF